LTIRLPRRITPRKAVALQQKWAPLVSEKSELPSKIENLVGCDATYFHKMTVAAATMVNAESPHLLRVKTVTERTAFPYVPGLLAFREAPSVLRAIRALRADSYVCLVDAHGLAHPRRFGLACFVGVVLDRPTIGVAKSLLYGSVKGRRLLDKEGRQIGELVVLPGDGKTIYVSVGHKVSLDDAVKIVKGCLTPRGPSPIIMAHDEVTRKRCQLKKSNPAYS
jgi:deoxyribonuclease V